MSHRRWLIVGFVLLLALTMLVNDVQLPAVYGLKENFTVPTKTPQPEPTVEPTSDNGGGGNPTSQPPTATARVPTAVPTARDLAPTPEGGFLPTAVPCGIDPTVFALAATNVREGPGQAYPVMAQLVFWEVRPIIGRSGDVPYWQISLVDGRIGWVDSTVVETQGNLSVIPIVAAPPLNGVTPTPTLGWNPPLPTECEPLPTRTAVPTQAPTTETIVLPPTETAVPPTAETNSSTAPTPETVANVIATQEPIAPPTAVSFQAEPLQANPLNVNQTSPSSTSIFAIAVGVLGLLGGGIALLRGRRGD